MAEDVLVVVREVLGSHTREPRLFEAPPGEVSLHALGISSVEMIGIMIDLEDRLGVTIDDLVVYDLATVGDLVAALDQRARG